MRLIDADFVKQRINETMSSDYVYSTNSIKNLIYEAPTIEAEPVVHCKDCKYVIPYESGGFNCLTCPNVDRDVDENWFCADGEKMDEVNE